MRRQGFHLGPAAAAWLGLWALLAALYYLGIHGLLRVAPAAAALAALGASLGLRFALGAFARASRAAEDRRVLARSLSGAMPQDGKRFAAAGLLAPMTGGSSGPPLAAPFSHRPCLAYRYRVGGAEAPAARGAGDLQVPAYAGLALAPAAIAAPSGSVRLLGFPRLERGFAETALGDEAARGHAADLLARTAFESLRAADWRALEGGAAALPADVRGGLRRDWRVAGEGPAGEGSAGDRLFETLVPAGEEVCGIGLYRAAEGGIAPDASPRGLPLRLFRGSGEAAAAVLARDGRRPAAAGLAALLVSHAAVAAFLLLLLRSR